MQYSLVLLFVFFCHPLYSYPAHLVQAWNTFLNKPVNCKVLELAVESRKNSVALERLDSLLHDYTAPSLEQAVSNMLSAELKLDPTKILIKEIADREGEEPVFRIFNDQNQPIMIVKGFGNYKEFLAEISSEDKFYTLNLPHVNAPAPIAFGKIMYKNIPVWLFAQTLAKGSVLGHIAMEKNTHHLSQALQALAVTTAEFHLAATQNPVPEPSPDEEPWIEFFNFSAVHPLLHLKDYFEPLNDFSNDLANKVHVNINCNTPVFVHGDYHWGNIVYDQSTGEIALIDLPTFHTNCLTKISLTDMRWAIKDFRTAIGNVHYFFVEGYINFDDIFGLIEDYALTYGSMVSRLKPDVSSDIFVSYWKMCALWAYLGEEVELYEDLFADYDLEKLQQTEIRLYTILQRMESERRKFQSNNR